MATAKIPKGKADSLALLADKFDWLDVVSDADEKRFLAGVTPQIGTDNEVVVLNVKVAQKGLIEIRAKTVLTDGRLIITDRRIILLSVARGGYNELPFDQIGSCKVNPVKWGALSTVECVVGRLPVSTEDLKLTFGFVGSGFWSNLLADLFSLFRPSVHNKIDATKERRNALNQIFGAVYKYRDA